MNHSSTPGTERIRNNGSVGHKSGSPRQRRTKTGNPNYSSSNYSNHSSNFSLYSDSQGKRYKCELCRTTYHDRQSLFVHIGEETKLTNPHWPCMELCSGEEEVEVCLRVFASEKGRNLHKISHAKDVDINTVG